MGREVRMVPENWKHPTDKTGEFIPLFDGSEYEDSLNKWIEGHKQWKKGLRGDYRGGWQPIGKEYKNMSFSEFYGGKPKKKDYMPVWKDKEKTLFMMYETCTDGTPISPAFTTMEELAHWLADNEASSFADMTATYEQWLDTIKSGSSASCALIGRNLVSGVEFESINETTRKEIENIKSINKIITPKMILNLDENETKKNENSDG